MLQWYAGWTADAVPINAEHSLYKYSRKRFAGSYIRESFLYRAHGKTALKNRYGRQPLPEHRQRGIGLYQQSRVFQLAQ